MEGKELVSRTNSSTTVNPQTSGSKPQEKPLMPLTRLKTESDIDDFVDDDLHHLCVLNNLEQNWMDISKNFETVVNHLQECTNQVNLASIECLTSLNQSIETTCDKVDTEMKSLYHLMTKCEELTTKLSIATSFRDEIKTLKKSIETLENLYKTKPV